MRSDSPGSRLATRSPSTGSIPRPVLGRAVLAICVAIAIAVATQTSVAATLTWNTTSGTWDLATPNWIPGPVAWTQTGTASASNDAVFGGTDGAYAVTLAGSQIAASNLTFNASGYTLSGTSLFLGSGTVTVAAGKTATISTAIRGTSGIRKDGAGTLTLSAANTFSGGVNLVSGTLLVGNASALGANLVDINGGNLGSSTAATLNITSGSFRFSNDFTAAVDASGQLTLSVPITLANGTRTINVSAGNGFNLYGGISDDGNGYGLIKTGAALMRLGGANTYTGDTRVNSGGLTIWTNLAAQHSTLDTDGAGTFNFTGANGATTPTIGGFKGSKNQAIGNAVASVTLNPVAGVRNIYSGVLSGSTSIIKINSGTQVFSGANTYTGATDIRAGTLQIGNSGTAGRLSLSSAITGSAGGTLAFSRTNSVTQGTDFNSVIGGGINVAQLGSGTLVLNGANTYTGTTAITAGVLALNHADALGGGGSVRFGGGTLRYSGSNTADYAARIRNSTAAVSIDTAGQNVLFAGGIDATNVGGLTKLGAGRLTLAGSNAYTGGTLVDAGSLIVNGSLVGDVVVGANSLLGGAGVLGNTLSGAGTISVGNSPGIGTAAAVNPSAGTDWIFEVTGTAPTWNAGGGASVNDVLRLTDSAPFLASLTSGNTVNVLFGLGATPVVQGSYLGGFFVDNAAFDLAAALAGGQFQYWVEGEYGTSGQRQQFPVGPDGASVTYSLLSAYDSSLTASYTIAQQTVDFGSGSVTGAVTQFIVVPEPHAAIAAGVGIALACGVLRNRRRAP